MLLLILNLILDLMSLQVENLSGIKTKKIQKRSDQSTFFFFQMKVFGYLSVEPMSFFCFCMFESIKNKHVLETTTLEYST